MPDRPSSPSSPSSAPPPGPRTRPAAHRVRRAPVARPARLGERRRLRASSWRSRCGRSARRRRVVGGGRRAARGDRRGASRSRRRSGSPAASSAPGPRTCRWTSSGTCASWTPPRRGPSSARALDARAHVCLRAWARTAVRVEVVDPADPTPYWLVSTRHPARLAAAIGRRAHRPGGPGPRPDAARHDGGRRRGTRGPRGRRPGVGSSRCGLRVRRRTPCRPAGRSSRRRAGCGGAPGSSSSR